MMLTLLGTLQHTVLPAGQQVVPYAMLPRNSNHCIWTGLLLVRRTNMSESEQGRSCVRHAACQSRAEG
jgi:hypothetical protein